MKISVRSYAMVNSKGLHFVVRRRRELELDLAGKINGLSV